MSDRKRILLVSRYSGDVEQNVKTIKALCMSVSILGHAPFASHLFCPEFLNDLNPSEREAGREIGLAWMAVCDEVWVWVHEIPFLSIGMQHDIEAARTMEKPIFAWTASDRIPFDEWRT